jgi:hypothetical protein
MTTMSVYAVIILLLTALIGTVVPYCFSLAISLLIPAL